MLILVSNCSIDLAALQLQIGKANTCEHLVIVTQKVFKFKAHSTHTGKHTHTHTHTHTHIHTNTHTHTNTFTHTCPYTHIGSHIHSHLHTRTLPNTKKQNSYKHARLHPFICKDILIYTQSKLTYSYCILNTCIF